MFLKCDKCGRELLLVEYPNEPYSSFGVPETCVCSPKKIQNIDKVMEVVSETIEKRRLLSGLRQRQKTRDR